MRFLKPIGLLIGILLCIAGFYTAYETTRAQTGPTSVERRESLGELLSSHIDTEIVHMDLTGQSDLLGRIAVHPSWDCPTSGFLYKIDLMGQEINNYTSYACTASGPDWTVDIYSVCTYATDGQWGCYTYVEDRADPGSPFVTMMFTNLGMPGVIGSDPTISDIPVYVWSNGMPVYYVTIWRWMGPGWWVPWHYWWYDSHNHPNWYYSYYNWWWWYYRWWGYTWRPWYNWYYTWWYWRYFYYWSTWFPY
jgi:hypothetical protein